VRSLAPSVGVHKLLHRDLVRDGLLDPDVAHLFSRLQRFRPDADYAAGTWTQ
jgi:hypothetical protein